MLLKICQSSVRRVRWRELPRNVLGYRLGVLAELGDHCVVMTC